MKLLASLKHLCVSGGYLDRQCEWKIDLLFVPFISGVVPEPSSQVASTGEAGGELHQGAGCHLHLLLALLWSLSRLVPGLLRPAAGPLALHPDHCLRLPAVSPRLHRRFAGPANQFHPVPASGHPVILAHLFPQPLGAGTRPPPASHGLNVPTGLLVPVLGRSQELQYRLAEDEGQGTYSVDWEDVVMLWRRTVDSALFWKRLTLPPAEEIFLFLKGGKSAADIWEYY